MKNIPVDRLQSKTSVGLQIKVFHPDTTPQNEMQPAGAHRDDHYIFFLLTKGSGTLMVDFQNITVAAGQLYYILPSQIHYRISTDRAEGWFLAVDPSLVPANLKEAFEGQLNLQLPCELDDYSLQQYSNLLELLRSEFVGRQKDKYYLPVIHTLLQSFLAMAASAYDKVQSAEHKNIRSTELARQFKNMLAANIHTIKSPSEYASRLNVSTGYLNEAIKKATGSTVSYWIQQEIFSEAKRLLYHSDADVKQIAYKLGYTDHSYFIRSFRKVCGLSPKKFRGLNRK